MISESNHIDCMDYMKTIQTGFFDIAIPDIPYGIGVNKMAFLRENKITVKQKNGSRLNPKKNRLIIHFGDWDFETPTQEYYNELKRVSKHQIIFGIDYVNWSGLGNGRIKWNKCVPDGVSFKSVEMAYCSMIDYTKEIKLLHSGMMQAKSLSEPTTQQGDKSLNEIRIHPTQKPVLLYKRIFLDFAKPGMKIFDSHFGSGSSRIAAYDMDLDWYGCEKDIIHFNDSEARFKKHTSQTKIYIQPTIA